MSPTSSVSEAIAALGAAFRELGVPWYLFGAQAALLYGSARLTADIDATVLLKGHSADDLVQVLAVQGYELAIADAKFIETTRVLPVVHRPSRIPADIVLGGPGLEELFASRARVKSIAGHSVPVARAEDLIAMKVLAGREKDQEDIVAILRACSATLEGPLIVETLSMLEEALGQSDLIPLFEKLQSRASGR